MTLDFPNPCLKNSSQPIHRPRTTHVLILGILGREPCTKFAKMLDEAHALWPKLGGTEVAWAAWSTPSAASSAAKADEARWEKPTKALPDFQLADLSDKTSTTKSLNGKVVLINLWATWCGPCNAELPQLQKLQKSLRRPDPHLRH